MTGQHAAAQRRASLTMIAFVVALVLAAGVLLYDGVTGMLGDGLLEPEVLGDCVEQVDGQVTPCPATP